MHRTAWISPSGTTVRRPRSPLRPVIGGRARCTELAVGTTGRQESRRRPHPARLSTDHPGRLHQEPRGARLGVMRRRSDPSSTTPVHRISGPIELLEAVPYLLGFHPQRSLVLVGLKSQRLVVTARLDLADARRPEIVEHTLKTCTDGGATSVVCVGYDDCTHPH